MQDVAGDGDPATSDGIFVFNGANTDNVSVGQVVRVTGTAGENVEQTQISVATPASTIVDCGTTADPPPIDIAFPIPEPVGGLSYLERFEGMRIRIPQAMVVTELFQLGRFGQVTIASERLPQPTNLLAPGGPGTPRAARQALNDRSRIVLDDPIQSQNPDPIVFGRGGLPLSDSNTLRGGDTISNTIGVLTYTWGGNAASPNAYRLRPTAPALFQAANPRPTAAPDVGGRLKVEALNLLNYFNSFSGCTLGVGGAATDCRGANSAAEFTRQSDKTVASILRGNADIVGVMELENDGYGPTSSLADLVGKLNAASAPGTYAAIDLDADTGRTNAAGGDAIRVAIIYKPASVTRIGPARAATDPIFDRIPVAQTFADATGMRFTIVVNHFKSKGSCPADASDPNADQGDGQGCWNVKRIAQAAALLSFINGVAIPAAGDSDVLVVGDLNSYAKEQPVAALLGGGYTNLNARFGGERAYSYAFDGQWGYLDHALASASLSSQVTGASELHINADEPSVLDYNTEFKSPAQQTSLYAPDPYRASDHDPVLIGLDMTAISSPPPFALYLPTVTS